MPRSVNQGRIVQIKGIGTAKRQKNEDPSNDLGQRNEASSHQARNAGCVLHISSRSAWSTFMCQPPNKFWGCNGPTSVRPHHLTAGAGAPETTYDRWDTENLHLSAEVIRNSLGPNLLQRVSSLMSADSPGPVIFKTALDQVMFVNATTVCTLSNQLGNLSLKSIPGELVPALSEQVTELAREIGGLGKPPTDLKNLILKPYTKGMVDEFKQHALTVHTTVMRGTHASTWQEMVAEHNVMYQDLVQLGDYPPAKGGKQDQDKTIQALIAKTINQHLQRWENKNTNGGNGGDGKSNKKRACFKCGSFDHLLKDCPNNKEEGKSKDGDGKTTNWRHLPPDSSKGEKKEKTVSGKTYKWCGKCRNNKGLWTTGKSLHSTSKHCSKKKSKGNEEEKRDKAGNLGYINEPLDFGHLTIIKEHPKGWRGDH